MVTEKGILKTEVAFNATKTERYLLRKVWDDKKPCVCLLMTNPSMANAVSWDMTTLYVVSNLHKIGYGGVDILNLTSVIQTKIDTKENIDLNSANIEQILKSAAKTQKVIIGWGKLGENNKKIRLVQLKLLEHLKPFEDKLFVIANEAGETGFHPLAPQIRFAWVLKKFVLPEYLQEKNDTKHEETTQSEPLQTDEQAAAESE